jgi:hypothetical protein
MIYPTMESIGVKPVKKASMDKIPPGRGSCLRDVKRRIQKEFGEGSRSGSSRMPNGLFQNWDTIPWLFRSPFFGGNEPD